MGMAKSLVWEETRTAISTLLLVHIDNVMSQVKGFISGRNPQFLSLDRTALLPKLVSTNVHTKAYCNPPPPSIIKPVIREQSHSLFSFFST